MKPVAHIVEETKPRVRTETLNIPEPTRFQWTGTDTVQMIVIMVLAFVSRFIKLGDATDNGTPVFDEKHYVPQAWDIVTSTDNPVTGGIESNPAYGLVVHPPLAKQLLAMGEMVFGYSPLGWRVMTALFSTITVLLIVAIARRLSHSPAVAAFAGILALSDGVILVAGRFGMLDIFLTGFVVAATYCFIRDHQQMRQRMYRAYIDGHVYVSKYGPRFGFRWWRFSAGVFLGLALSVKWSGLYYMAFYGVMTVLLDYLLRRQYKVAKPLLGTLLRDSLPAFASVVILPVALYAWSWRAWFAGETSVYRHAKENGTLTDEKWYYNLPDSVANWFYYHDSVLKFHASLTSSSGHSHPWDSKPWSWLVASRPVLYYSQTGESCEGMDNCRRMIYLFGAPAIWWLTVPVVLWALWRLIIHKDRRFFVPLVGFAASFVPWLIAYDRQMYFFYAIPLVPFTIVMLALTLGLIANSQATFRIPGIKEPLTLGKSIVIGYLALVIIGFFYFSPIYYGTLMTEEHYNSIMWLRSWR
ncbi:putative dolichyl-phosphate-mannose--protein mannosyltransferase [Corynebacterium kalinowskii]|uniref:Polyprenol-phosphate-mannose--protein mannosyltransferase n=1 Tax=Corynebacterium kalinowskii TaxID=2675216 RepID=A0A6B8VRM6_9CORY|nr:phospholipid carrier-dependent glycosyltransferase [Corynebacterium kalinowskii]QGU02521.1 putative dolichyl-phosphate-mannose--protein mannosyltransferase [Corynebacterium kalinowskii]